MKNGGAFPADRPEQRDVDREKLVYQTRETLLRFGERVETIEKLAKDRPLESIPAAELDQLWNEAKKK